ncbi:MAG TPA: lipid II flippase MurJ [Xanthobacteraceae bacterium]
MYYADRLNQLPIGVIGIAAGTVLLPDLARRIAGGDEAGARHAQNRAIELTLILALPFLVGFLAVPELIMRALFMRGAFTAADAAAAGATLRAYAIGLVPFVLIRSMVATFFARGDTATPVKASLTAVAVNIAFKILLMGPLAQIGLALATSIGAWINVALVGWLAWRAGFLRTDAALKRSVLVLAGIGVVLALALWLAEQPVAHIFAGGRLAEVATLLTLAGFAALLYGGALALALGPRARALLRQMKP